MDCLVTTSIEDFNTTLRQTGCDKCVLSKMVRTKVVISRGNPRAKIMIVGQNPGADEDRFGSPFVGRAGILLDKMFKAINLDTNKDCYLTNAALCWTPQNEDPTKYPGVLDACRPYLEKQTELLKPEIIIAVGKPAFESLTKKKCTAWLRDTVGKLDYNSGPTSRHYSPTDDPALDVVERYPVFPIMHPAYLLRNEAEKPTAWEHMKILSRLIEQNNSISDYRRVA